MAKLTIDLPEEVMEVLQRAAHKRGRAIVDEAREWMAGVMRNEDVLAEHDLMQRIRRTRAKLASAGVWITSEEVRAARDEGRA